MKKINEVNVDRKLGIGSIPLADKVNELTRVINLLLEERKGAPFNWERSQSELAMEKVVKRREEGERAEREEKT